MFTRCSRPTLANPTEHVDLPNTMYQTVCVRVINICFQILSVTNNAALVSKRFVVILFFIFYFFNKYVAEKIRDVAE